MAEYDSWQHSTGTTTTQPFQGAPENHLGGGPQGDLSFPGDRRAPLATGGPPGGPLQDVACNEPLEGAPTRELTADVSGVSGAPWGPSLSVTEAPQMKEETIYGEQDADSSSRGGSSCSRNTCNDTPVPPAASSSSNSSSNSSSSSKSRCAHCLCAYFLDASSVPPADPQQQQLLRACCFCFVLLLGKADPFWAAAAVSSSNSSSSSSSSKWTTQEDYHLEKVVTAAPPLLQFYCSVFKSWARRHLIVRKLAACSNSSSNTSSNTSSSNSSSSNSSNSSKIDNAERGDNGNADAEGAQGTPKPADQQQQQQQVEQQQQQQQQQQRQQLERPEQPQQLEHKAQANLREPHWTQQHENEQQQQQQQQQQHEQEQEQHDSPIRRRLLTSADEDEGLSPLTHAGPTPTEAAAETAETAAAAAAAAGEAAPAAAAAGEAAPAAAAAEAGVESIDSSGRVPEALSPRRGRPQSPRGSPQPGPTGGPPIGAMGGPPGGGPLPASQRFGGPSGGLPSMEAPLKSSVKEELTRHEETEATEAEATPEISKEALVGIRQHMQQLLQSGLGGGPCTHACTQEGGPSESPEGLQALGDVGELQDRLTAIREQIEAAGEEGPRRKPLASGGPPADRHARGGPPAASRRGAPLQKPPQGPLPELPLHGMQEGPLHSNGWGAPRNNAALQRLLLPPIGKLLGAPSLSWGKKRGRGPLSRKRGPGLPRPAPSEQKGPPPGGPPDG
ncbi:hypothetical protein Emed_004102 [Eimeria media]